MTPTPQQIIEAVSKRTGVHEASITGPGRTKRVIAARDLCVGLMRYLRRMSYPEIGAALNRAHNSAIVAHRRLPALDVLLFAEAEGWMSPRNRRIHADWVVAELRRRLTA